MAIAQSLLAAIAIAIGELEIAEKTARSVLIASTERHNALIVDDARSTLLSVLVRKAAATMQRGEQPALIDTDVGKTLWGVVQKEGPTKSMVDVIQAEGFSFSPGPLLNKPLGADSPVDVRTVLNASIDLSSRLPLLTSSPPPLWPQLWSYAKTREVMGLTLTDRRPTHASRFGRQHPMSAGARRAASPASLGHSGRRPVAPGRVDEKLLT